MKVYFLTLGCRVNQYETDSMRAIFEKDGFVVVDFEDDGNRKQIVTNRHIWIDNSPEVEKNIKNYFKERIELSVVPLC